MRWLVLAVCIARSAAADPGDGVASTDYQWAELHATTARSLARHGHCDEALKLRPRIEELDPEVAHRAFTDDPYLAACVAGTPIAPGSALGAPSQTAPVATPAVTPQRACSPRAYLEPSLLMVSDGGQPTAFNRVAAGVLVRNCVSPVQVRLGATAYIGHVGTIGAGLEGELDNALGDTLRIGAHAAYESADGGALYSVDLRLHYDDVVWVQAGAYQWTRYGSSDAGIAVGVGFEGTPGAVLGGIELGAGGVVFLMLLAALSGTH